MTNYNEENKLSNVADNNENEISPVALNEPIKNTLDLNETETEQELNQCEVAESPSDNDPTVIIISCND